MNELANIEKELLQSIPILDHMEVKILYYGSDKIVIGSKLESHYNYEGTAFGGSLNTLALLPCYLMAGKILKDKHINPSSLVIQDSSIKYLKPVTQNFTATCYAPDASDFIHYLLRRKVARIELSSVISHSYEAAELVKFSGRFVVNL